MLQPERVLLALSQFQDRIRQPRPGEGPLQEHDAPVMFIHPAMRQRGAIQVDNEKHGERTPK